MNQRLYLFFTLFLFAFQISAVETKLEDSKNLLNTSGLKLMPYYIYAEHYNRNDDCDFAENLFTSSLTDLQQIEPGITLEKFQAALKEFKNNSSSSKALIVQINAHRRLLKGAMHIAICALHNQKIPVTLLPIYDLPESEFSKNIPRKYLDHMALYYCKLNHNVYVASVFPSAQGKQQEIEKIFQEYGKIIYQKSVQINANKGAVNFIRHLYENEGWVGNIQTLFKGAYGKARNCFPPNKPGLTRVFLFECDSLEKVRACKKKIRDLFRIGNDSIHINDTHHEALAIARIVFNENTIHFVNHANIIHLKKFEEYVASYRKLLRESKVDSDFVCIDGSAVLSAYGIRDCRDLDVIHHGYDQQIKQSPYLFIGSHNGHEMQYHSTNSDDIIFNPENHFYYKGVKFTSLELLKKMKIRRNEQKDRNDVLLIDQLN